MRLQTFNRLFPLVESGKVAAGPMTAADHLAFLLDRPINEVNGNGELIAEGLLKSKEIYNPDFLIVFADISVDAEAMGAEFNFPATSNPNPKRNLDSEQVSTVDMAVSGRIPELFKAAEIVRRETSDGFPIFFSIKDPFSLAAVLIGTDRFLISLQENPESARRLLEKCCLSQIGLVKTICERGFIPLVGAPIASGSLIGPGWFEKFVEPYLSRLFDVISEQNSFRCIHICGEVASLTPSITRLKPDLLSIEEWDTEMWKHLPDTIPMGYVSTFLFNSQDTERVEKATIECLENLPKPCIISTACDLPPKANPVLVKNMMEIAGAIAPPLGPPSECAGDSFIPLHNITINPENSILEVKQGANIKRELERHGRVFLNNCGNRGECLSCSAIFSKNAPEMTETERLAFGEHSRSRMTCQHTVTEDVTIFLPPHSVHNIKKPLSNFRATGGGSGWGIGVDLGSTVIALYLTNLESGEVVNQHSFLNPQIKFGGDVMSRLEAAKNKKKLTQITSHTHAGIAKAIDHLCKSSKISRTNVGDFFIAGNSVMSHFWLGHGGEGIERVPFRSFLEGQGSVRFDPKIVGLPSSSDCKLCPVIEGFIGGDTVAAILASDLDLMKGRRLLIDLGTNGEIVLAKDGELCSTSTAAGPAFEGVGMTSGMPAVPGAIRGFTPDGDPDVIGGLDSMGICGSGYIAVIADLLETGVMSPTGLLEKDKHGNRHWSINSNVVVDQGDIRKFQLAKGAVAAGVETLFKRAGMKSDSLDEVILTGSFGSRVDPVSAIKIALIPDISVSKVTFVDNGAGRGAVLCLGSQVYQARAEQIQKRTRVVNLGETNGFEELFVLNMHFPGSELNEI
ncbi:MAG: DUF4445 domain-containing protein [Calditrichaeota bacterium]|nr:DUF4445 domain-containing protein [Calditrichota bacterium]